MKASKAVRGWLPQNIEILGRERTLARGEILFRKDDAAVGIYEIEHGQMRLSRIDQTGSEIVLHVAGAGDLIAEASLFAKVYHCDATPVTDARARLYPKEALLAEYRRNPQAAEAFASRLAHELMALSLGARIIYWRWRSRAAIEIAGSSSSCPSNTMPPAAIASAR